MNDPYIRKGVTYGDAETRGRLRHWKAKLARDYHIFDSYFQQLQKGSLQHLAEDMVRGSRSTRRRAFEKMRKGFGPGVTLEEVKLDKRGHALAIWSILKPRNSVTISPVLVDNLMTELLANELISQAQLDVPLPKPSRDKVRAAIRELTAQSRDSMIIKIDKSTTESENASLAQDCVTLNYVVVGTDMINVAEGLWTLEVPDHALGRAVERSRFLHPEVLIRDAHKNLLELPTSILDRKHINGESFYIKAGAGCFVAYFRIHPDVSIGKITSSVRVVTWLDNDQLGADQIVISDKGEKGQTLGDSFLKPHPFVRFKLEDSHITLYTRDI